MTEETALEILLELIEHNEKLDVLIEWSQTITTVLGLSAMLISLIFGAFIIFILTRTVGKGM